VAPKEDGADFRSAVGATMTDVMGSMWTTSGANRGARDVPPRAREAPRARGLRPVAPETAVRPAARGSFPE
jgi:hypothetical protein